MPRPENPPAFPYEVQSVVDGLDGGSGGMSLRDYFAAKAMQAMLSDAHIRGRAGDDAAIARMAYESADAMLVERER